MPDGGLVLAIIGPQCADGLDSLEAWIKVRCGWVWLGVVWRGEAGQGKAGIKRICELVWHGEVWSGLVG